jgi:hypothetical protein
MINDAIIEKMLKYNDFDYNNKKYKYLGKGGDGIVYECNNKVVKLFTKDDIDSIIKEMYVTHMLKSIPNVSVNIILVDDYSFAFKYPLAIMEKLDNDLTYWINMMIKMPHGEMNDDDIDLNWTSMIFQLSHGLLFMNKYKILHNDAKPKNILYKENNAPSNIIEYAMNNKKYIIPCRYIFKISDFGAIQIKKSKLNTMSNKEIENKIKTRDDLRELSRVFFRIYVDYGMKLYNYEYMKTLAKNDKLFGAHFYNESKKIDKQLGNYNRHVKDKFIHRNLLYYAIENNYIDKNDIVKHFNLRIPSDDVMFILDNITNIDVDVYSLFDQFLS